MKILKCFSLILFKLSGMLLCAGLILQSVLAQQNEQKAISFEKKIEILITNPNNALRKNEPVTIPVDDIKKKYPDFNAECFRLKYPSQDVEPLDIPSQVRSIPYIHGKQEIVFLVDLVPSEKRIVDL